MTALEIARAIDALPLEERRKLIEKLNRKPPVPLPGEQPKTTNRDPRQLHTR